MKWVQLCGSLNILWHCPSLGFKWKLTFSSPMAKTVFQICWHIKCSTFTASSFRIWNSSTGIPLPPLALFIVMLPKAHLKVSLQKKKKKVPHDWGGLWFNFKLSTKNWDLVANVKNWHLQSQWWHTEVLTILEINDEHPPTKVKNLAVYIAFIYIKLGLYIHE